MRRSVLALALLSGGCGRVGYAIAPLSDASLDVLDAADGADDRRDAAADTGRDTSPDALDGDRDGDADADLDSDADAIMDDADAITDATDDADGSPAGETCNGFDDDADGRIDEGLLSVGATMQVDTGLTVSATLAPAYAAPHDALGVAFLDDNQQVVFITIDVSRAERIGTSIVLGGISETSSEQELDAVWDSSGAFWFAYFSRAIDEVVVARVDPTTGVMVGSSIPLASQTVCGRVRITHDVGAVYVAYQLSLSSYLVQALTFAGALSGTAMPLVGPTTFDLTSDGLDGYLVDYEPPSTINWTRADFSAGETLDAVVSDLDSFEALPALPIGRAAARYDAVAAGRLVEVTATGGLFLPVAYRSRAIRGPEPSYVLLTTGGDLERYDATGVRYAETISTGVSNGYVVATGGTSGSRYVVLSPAAFTSIAITPIGCR